MVDPLDRERESLSIWTRATSHTSADVSEGSRSASPPKTQPNQSIAYAAADQVPLDISAMVPTPLFAAPRGSGGAGLRLASLPAPPPQRSQSSKWAPDAAAQRVALGMRASSQEQEILASPEYNALTAPTKAQVDWIIAKANQAPLGDGIGQRNYYLAKLKVALTTPFEGEPPPPGGGYGRSPAAERDNRAAVEGALRNEAALKRNDDRADEKAVATGNLVPRTGKGGTIFYIDDSDSKNVRVKMKVHLTGSPEDVAKIKKLEDAIERASRTAGYHLDIEFVDQPGPDVFEKTVDMAQWPNSGNWASDPVSLSHEAHHALGLDDRYDYIEHHSDNPQIDVPSRITLFVSQMQKPAGQDDINTKMYDAALPLSPYDVCTLGTDPHPQPKTDNCVKDRKTLTAGAQAQ